MGNILKSSRKELLSAIRIHCIECAGGQKQVRYCTSPDCKLFHYRMRPNQHIRQTDVFRLESKEFFEKIIEKAERYDKPFWFSELRHESRIYPVSSNMWGTVAKRMLKNGFRQTGLRRKSPIKICKGHQEFQYVRTDI